MPGSVSLAVHGHQDRERVVSFLLLDSAALDALTTRYTAFTTFAALLERCRRHRYMPTIYGHAGPDAEAKALLADAVEAAGCRVYRGGREGRRCDRRGTPIVSRLSLREQR